TPTDRPKFESAVESADSSLSCTTTSLGQTSRKTIFLSMLDCSLTFTGRPPLSVWVLAIFLFFASATALSQKLSEQEIEQKVDFLLKQMTLEEKAGQLAQFPGSSPQTIEMIKRGKVGSLLGVLGAEQANEAQRAAVEGSRLHIPLILGYDV